MQAMGKPMKTTYVSYPIRNRPMWMLSSYV